ncbi:phosphotriesterase [Rhodococcus qingshengii]|uniref:phosphotriesterase family protein n=2 Tax=Rhodococcus qingshengii TaxID=334542 RepID=UPI00370074E1
MATPAVRTVGACTLMSKVRTVTGTVDSSELGLVLPHEHLHNDVTGAYTEAPDPVVAQRLAGPVRAEDAWLLHDNPYYSLDNCRVDDGSAVVEDLADFARLGGRTIVDLTPPGLGRAPEKLAEFSRKSDVRVIMGSGWYLETTHPVEVHELGVDDLAGSLVEEFDPAKELAPGVIGEIGVSPLFTQNEAKALRAACIAQREVDVPLFVHLPGWQRVGHHVVDIVVDEMGVDPQAVVLCHMDPSGHDADYQRSLADRGVLLEFDMIGMPFDFPGEGLSPHPAETATAVAGLVTSGHASQLLLSHDLFLKSMLRKHGGNGFSYVPLAFAARLVRAGVDPQQVSALMRDNPRSLFEQAAKGNRSSHG